jgi:hypothetical protein
MATDSQELRAAFVKMGFLIANGGAQNPTAAAHDFANAALKAAEIMEERIVARLQRQS